MLAQNAFSHWKLDVPFASLAISAASARTLRSAIAGIGTELLAHREKIEVTRNGSPSERSPVPIGRAHCHCTRAGTSRRNLIVLFEFDDFQTCWLDQSANRSVVRQAWMEPPHLRTEKLPACCARTTRKTLSPVPSSCVNDAASAGYFGDLRGRSPEIATRWRRGWDSNPRDPSGFEGRNSTRV